MKILIVDDEVRYRSYLGRALGERGHEARTADSGHSGIDAGVRFQPDVLVADWLLCNDYHGLQVSEVLRAVTPGMQTVLITGFPSEDLQEEAAGALVFRFLKKPFDLEELVRSVEAAGAAPPAAPPRRRLATFEMQPGGGVENANALARERFAAASIAPDANLGEVLGSDTVAALWQAAPAWIEVTPRATERWWLRSRPLDSNRLCVLLNAGDEALQRDPVVQLLLGASPDADVTWPWEDRVLVIDDTRIVRRSAVQVLQRAGCVCYKAESPDLALRILRAEPRIGVVLLDYNMAGVDPGAMVPALLELRPDLKIVGNSLGGRQKHFAALGVHRYLAKPWTVRDLVDLLAQG